MSSPAEKHRDRVSFCTRVTHPLKNVNPFLWSFASIPPPLCLLTSLTATELSLEESGKHQWGMRGIFCFSFPLKPPPLLPLLSLFWTPLSVQRARLLSFPVSERRPTITTSHKQREFVDWGGGPVAIAGMSYQSGWPSKPSSNPQKYRLHGRIVRFKGYGKKAACL